MAAGYPPTPSGQWSMHNNESHKVRGLSETEGWPRSVEFPDALTVNSTWIN